MRKTTVKRGDAEAIQMKGPTEDGNANRRGNYTKQGPAEGLDG